VTALVAALLDDPAARAAATAAATAVARAFPGPGTRGMSRAMEVAARAGMTDPALRRAGLTFVDTAVTALTRAGQPQLAAEVEGFGERYPAAGRCPADDRLTASEERA
jgi:glutamate--cysteine ligase